MTEDKTETPGFLKTAQDKVQEQYQGEPGQKREQLRKEKEAEVYLSQAYDIKEDDTLSDDQKRERLEKLNQQIMDDETMRDFIEEHGYDTGSLDMELTEEAAEEPAEEIDDSSDDVEERLEKVMVAIDDLAGLYDFVREHTQERTRTDADGIIIQNYLKGDYPDLAKDLRSWGLNKQPEDNPDNLDNVGYVTRLAQEAVRIREAKPNGNLSSADFDLPSMPEPILQKVTQILDNSIPELTKKSDNLAMYAYGRRKREILDGLEKSTADDLSYTSYSVQGSRPHSLTTMEQNLSELIEEAATRYPWSSQDQLEEYAKVPQQALEAAQAVVKEYNSDNLSGLETDISSDESRESQAQEFLNAHSEISDQEIQEAIRANIVRKLAAENRRQQETQQKADQETDQYLDQFSDWNLAAYRGEGTAPDYLSFSIDIDDNDIREPLFSSEKISYVQGNGVYALAGGDYTNYPQIIGDVVRQITLAHRQSRRNKTAKARDIGTDVHAYLRGVNAGYANEELPVEDGNNWFQQGVRRGQELRT